MAKVPHSKFWAVVRVHASGVTVDVGGLLKVLNDRAGVYELGDR